MPERHNAGTVIQVTIILFKVTIILLKAMATQLDSDIHPTVSRCGVVIPDSHSLVCQHNISTVTLCSCVTAHTMTFILDKNISTYNLSLLYLN